jgi:hypothetical protein
MSMAIKRQHFSKYKGVSELQLDVKITGHSMTTNYLAVANRMKSAMHQVCCL